MNQDTVAYGLSFIVGIALIGYAMFSRRQRAPIDWNIPKFGAFKMDFAAFLITLGIIVASAGLIFKWKGFSERIDELEKNGTATEAKMKVLQSSLDRFKDYELEVALEFLDTVTLANSDGVCASSPCLKVETYMKKNGGSWALTDGRVSRDPELSNLV